jgi:hypothetical protein
MVTGYGAIYSKANRFCFRWSFPELFDVHCIDHFFQYAVPGIGVRFFQPGQGGFFDASLGCQFLSGQARIFPPCLDEALPHHVGRQHFERSSFFLIAPSGS